MVHLSLTQSVSARDVGLFSSKVDECVPETQRVNLIIVGISDITTVAPGMVRPNTQALQPQS